jgi:hypothetical protein
MKFVSIISDLTIINQELKIIDISIEFQEARKLYISTSCKLNEFLPIFENIDDCKETIQSIKNELESFSFALLSIGPPLHNNTIIQVYYNAIQRPTTQLTMLISKLIGLLNTKLILRRENETN